MKRILFIALLCCVPFLGWANNAASLFRQANKDYESGNYKQAIEKYQSILQQGEVNANLYYNLGNCYFRMGELGMSVLHYERALRLDPSNSDIKENLAFVRSKTEDNIEDLPQLFLVTWAQQINHWWSGYGWMTVTILLLILTCSAFVLFFLSHAFQVRKYSLLASIVFLFLLIFSVVNVTVSARHSSKSKEAIVLSPSEVVKSSPDAKSMDKFVLHEGTKVRVDDHLEGWSLIRIADGSKGWVEDTSIEQI